MILCQYRILEQTFTVLYNTENWSECP